MIKEIRNQGKVCLIPDSLLTDYGSLNTSAVKATSHRAIGET